MCSSEFGRFSGNSSNRRLNVAPSVKGCSVGLDADDYRFKRSGSLQDGWDAIVCFAASYVSEVESFDGVSLGSQCSPIRILNCFDATFSYHDGTTDEKVHVVGNRRSQ